MEQANETDALDLSELLSNADFEVGHDLSNFVNIRAIGENSTVSFNAEGNGPAGHYLDIALFSNVNVGNVNIIHNATGDIDIVTIM